MSKTILVDRLCGETCLALIEDGALAELYFESKGHEKLTGNIYVGRVENVLPGMNAAFVNIGLDKNAFLYAGDICVGDAQLAEQLRGARIERLVRPGQTVVVQVAKEPGGNKGPRLSCHITLAGRLTVLLPTVGYVGVSRRIRDEGERERLRLAAEELLAGAFGHGVIVRTAAEGASAEALRADFEALCRLWAAIEQRGEHVAAPALLHRDGSLIDCAVRDMLCEDVESVRTDDDALLDALRETARTLTPAFAARIVLDRAQSPLFDRFCVWKQAESAFRRLVWLKSGGYLVFDYTEALTVVDVNTGKFVGKRSLSETVFALNCEAAREIARQLRLRDVGGIVIIDFIDMDRSQQREALLDVLRECLRKDRTRTNLVGITALGLVELTRKIVRQPLSKHNFHVCGACQGSGLVPSHEFTARLALCEVRRRRMRGDDTPYVVFAAPPVAGMMLKLGAPVNAGVVRVLADETIAEAEYRFEPFDPNTPPSGAKLLKECTEETL